MPSDPYFGLCCLRGIIQLIEYNLTDIKVFVLMHDESFILDYRRFISSCDKMELQQTMTKKIQFVTA